jgi:hypothetical protein
MPLGISRPPGYRSPDEELAALILRAAQLGIPAWRVMTALGVPLPAAPDR